MQEKSKDKAEDENQLLIQVVEHLPIGLFAKDVDQDYKFVLWNKKMEELIGLTSDETLGKNDYDFFDKKEADYYRKTDQGVLANKKIIEIPEEVVSATAGPLPAHTIKVPLYHDNGKPKLLLGLIEDLREYKNTKQHLQEKIAELEEFKRLTVNRELRMAHIKEENKTLKAKLSKLTHKKKD